MIISKIDYKQKNSKCRLWQRWNSKSQMRKQQTGTKGIQEKVLLGKKGNTMRIVQEIEIWSCWQILRINEALI